MFCILAAHEGNEATEPRVFGSTRSRRVRANGGVRPRPHDFNLGRNVSTMISLATTLETHRADWAVLGEEHPDSLFSNMRRQIGDEEIGRLT
jgi:hypothetical protein